MQNVFRTWHRLMRPFKFTFTKSKFVSALSVIITRLFSSHQNRRIIDVRICRRGMEYDSTFILIPPTYVDVFINNVIWKFFRKPTTILKFPQY